MWVVLREQPSLLYACSYKQDCNKIRGGMSASSYWLFIDCLYKFPQICKHRTCVLLLITYCSHHSILKKLTDEVAKVKRHVEFFPFNSYTMTLHGCSKSFLERRYLELTETVSSPGNFLVFSPRSIKSTKS